MTAIGRSFSAHPARLGGALIVAIALSAIVWYLASPLFVRTYRNEALPPAEPSAAASAGFTSTTGLVTEESPPASPRAVRSGQLGYVDSIHNGTGTVRFVELGGTSLIRFDDVAITNAPDVHVYLSRETGGKWTEAQIAGDDEEWAEVRDSAERLAREAVRVRVKPEDRAAIYEEDGELHPVRYVRALAGAAGAAGARLHEGTRAIAVTKDEVRTERARVRAGAVVVCVNAYSRYLVPLRVRPVRGQMLATAPVGRRVFERPAYANRGYRYWRQRADGSLLVGGWRDTAADEEIGEDERTTPRIQRQLDRFLHERCPDAKVTHRWAGTMGFSHDALPYIGRLASGVFVNAGFTGHGMAFATASGELVADLLAGKRRNETDLYAPERP